MNTCPPLPLTHPPGFVCLLKHQAEKRWTEGQDVYGPKQRETNGLIVFTEERLEEIMRVNG